MIFHDIIVWDQIKSVLESLLTTYHSWVGNWGLAIILLTITVRVAILPLTIKQLRSMAAMQAIQPKVKALQNKYKGKTAREDKQQMQQELMALYKEHNVNPFASCLPMVFQIPVFIGLYRVLTNFAHQNPPPPGSPSFLGIDNIFHNLGTIGGPTEYIMVIIYLASMLGSTLLFSFVTDKQQKYMFAAMSVFFVFFIIRVPAGVGIYWITTNLWTIGQQGVIKQRMGHHFPHLQEKKGGGGKGPGKGGNGAKPTPKRGGGGGRGKGQRTRTGGRRR
ncbi:MAG: YidC/Oxa1 family membrane protein insertase [Gaiellales bacterium]